MAGRKNNSSDDTSDREFVVSRVFDAPRELVWQAMTDPQHVVHWWGPRGFSTTIETMDVRPGGIWKQTLRGPDGALYPNKSVFKEVTKPERLVYSHAGGRQGGPGASFVATWTFEALGPKQTRVTIRAVFPKPEDRDFVIKEFSALEGAKQTLARLAEHLPVMSSGGADRDIVTTRVIQAPRELVWRAWTEPEHLARWWGPRGFRNTFRDFELRPGGHWRFVMHSPDGTDHENECIFREIAGPERLVFEHLGPVHWFEVTATFEALRETTRVTFRMRFDSAEECARVRSIVSEANEQNFDRLETELAMMGAITKPFVISREFAAPRERVFQMWTERDHLMQWWGPKGSTVSFCKNDLRAGGMMHFCLRAANGDEMWGKWVYRDIAPPEWLVFVHSFSDPSGNTTHHPIMKEWPLEFLSSIMFTERGGRTTVTVSWVPLNRTPTELKTFDENHASMKGGWTGTFDQLENYLAEQGAARPA